MYTSTTIHPLIFLIRALVQIQARLPVRMNIHDLVDIMIFELTVRRVLLTGKNFPRENDRRGRTPLHVHLDHTLVVLFFVHDFFGIVRICEETIVIIYIIYKAGHDDNVRVVVILPEPFLRVPGPDRVPVHPPRGQQPLRDQMFVRARDPRMPILPRSLPNVQENILLKMFLVRIIILENMTEQFGKQLSQTRPPADERVFQTDCHITCVGAVLENPVNNNQFLRFPAPRLRQFHTMANRMEINMKMCAIK